MRLTDSEADGDAKRGGSGGGVAEGAVRGHTPEGAAAVGIRRAQPPGVGGTANDILNF